MIRLVVNNTHVNKDYLTCRNSCELFDEITTKCAIKDNVNVDDRMEVLRCGHFIDKSEINTKGFRFSLIEDEGNFDFDDENLFHEFLGEKFKREDSMYPLQPDFPSKRNDAIWYVSPKKDFGCWIINKSKRKLVSLPKDDELEYGWGKNVYKSPIPFHDHKASLSLASKMAWYIDEEGFGQYVLLTNGQISQISKPKPKNWTK